MKRRGPVIGEKRESNEDMVTVYTPAIVGVCLAIPESIGFIGDFVFTGCVSLRSVWLSENIEMLGHFAFANCDDCSFYCESFAKPEGWDEQWNGVAPLGETVWGASYDEFRSA